MLATPHITFILLLKMKTETEDYTPFFHRICFFFFYNICHEFY